MLSTSFCEPNFMIYSHRKQCTMLPMTWEWCSVLPLQRNSRRRTSGRQRVPKFQLYGTTIFVFHPGFFCLTWTDSSDTAPGRSPTQAHQHLLYQPAPLANNTKGMYNCVARHASKPLDQEIRLNPLEMFDLGAVIGYRQVWGLGKFGKKTINLLTGRSDVVRRRLGEGANCRLP